MKPSISFASFAAICLIGPLNSCKPSEEAEEIPVVNTMPQKVLVTDLASLVDSEWKLVDLCGMDVGDEGRMTLKFMPDGRISGDAAVNRFSGPTRVDDDVIEIGPMVTTRMAGPPDAMERESAYLAALSEAISISTLGEDNLIIAVEGKDLPLRFEKAKQP